MYNSHYSPFHISPPSSPLSLFSLSVGILFSIRWTSLVLSLRMTLRWSCAVATVPVIVEGHVLLASQAPGPRDPTSWKYRCDKQSMHSGWIRVLAQRWMVGFLLMKQSQGVGLCCTHERQPARSLQES